jgi:hypothetical protein
LDGGIVLVVITKVAKLKCWKALKPEFVAKFE